MFTIPVGPKEFFKVVVKLICNYYRMRKAFLRRFRWKLTTALTFSTSLTLMLLNKETLKSEQLGFVHVNLYSLQDLYTARHFFLLRIASFVGLLLQTGRTPFHWAWIKHVSSMDPTSSYPGWQLNWQTLSTVFPVQFMYPLTGWDRDEHGYPDKEINLIHH